MMITGTGMRSTAKPNPKYVDTEEKLAREMSKLKIDHGKKRVEIERICANSEEIKELQERIRNAYLNKERGAQLAEAQLRTEKDVEEDARIDMAMLRNKEMEDERERQIEYQRAIDRINNKRGIQGQMEEKEFLKIEAQKEYEREKGQVEEAVQRLIDEENETMRLFRAKQDQAKLDMRQSLLEKRRQMEELKRIENEEEENVRRYAREQAEREATIRREKAKVEAERDAIYSKLKEEEEARRAEQEYIERVRVELYQEEFEERERERERIEAEKRINTMHELLRAQEYQRLLKQEREAEEKRLEEEFKAKMLEKFAEDDRVEQLNAQRRRMKEQEHKREVERLWQEKLALYREQMEIEQEEKRLKEEEEQRQQDIVRLEMERLLAEHGDVLNKYHPKASTAYGSGFPKVNQ